MSYTAIKDKCERFACSLLSACKTTHEVQILLQTRKRDAGKVWILIGGGLVLMNFNSFKSDVQNIN